MLINIRRRNVKKWMKYLINTIIFCIIYMIVEYLLTKNINWKMIIASTIIYAILYTATDLISNKLTTKE